MLSATARRRSHLILLICGCLLAVAPIVPDAWAQGAPPASIIVDHTSVADFDRIPEWALLAAAKTRIVMRHASVGVTVSDGLDCLQGTRTSPTECTQFPDYRYDRKLWRFQLRPNNGWHGKVDDFKTEVARQIDSADVFMFKYCYLDGLDGLQEPCGSTYKNVAEAWEYLRSAMEQLEGAHPEKRFVWWTIPLTQVGQLCTDTLNGMIRAYATSHGKILFDIADIEARDEVEHPQRDVRGYEIAYKPFCGEQQAGAQACHPNWPGKIRLARAFWWMMSVIAGWDPSTAPGVPIAWKHHFTLDPAEGTSFVLDTTTIAKDAGVPVLSITRDSAVILGTSGTSPRMFEVRNNAHVHVPVQPAQRGPDGGFVYLPDGRVRLVCEEPAPGSTEQRRKSRIVSWISSDGRAWTKEQGIRYQPGAADDSISSVPSVMQVRDSVWRLYYVGDFYRTNGTRTAISTDWGVTWRAESAGNILGSGDVDPQPVYLNTGGIRLYFRSGMPGPGVPPGRPSGIAYNDSPDGLAFDTSRTRIVIADTAGGGLLKLDPAVMRFADGEVVCWMGAVTRGSQPVSRVMLARSKPAANPVDDAHAVPHPARITLTVIPQPVRGDARVAAVLGAGAVVRITVHDALGRIAAVLADTWLERGTHAFALPVLPAGRYIVHAASAHAHTSVPLTVLR